MHKYAYLCSFYFRFCFFRDLKSVLFSVLKKDISGHEKKLCEYGIKTIKASPKRSYNRHYSDIDI